MNLVLYHEHCQDGFFSAYLAWKKFGDIDTRYISVNHRPVLDMVPMDSINFILKQVNVDIEQCKNINLYVLDFCFPNNYIKLLSELFKSVLILDHHQTAFAELKVEYTYTINTVDWYIFDIAENTKVIISQEESAAKIVHKYFYKDKIVPWYIELVSDRDLNKNFYQDTDKFYHGITLYKPYDFVTMDYLVTTDFKDIIALGELVERNKLDIVKNIVKNTVEINLSHKEKKIKGAFINTDLSNASDVGNYLLFCLKQHEFCIVYSIKSNKTVHCSIRSNNNFNSLIISEKFKGGGHKTSGGFVISLIQFYDILNNNNLEI